MDQQFLILLTQGNKIIKATELSSENVKFAQDMPSLSSIKTEINRRGTKGQKNHQNIRR